MSQLTTASFPKLASACDNTNGFFRDLNIERAFLSTGGPLTTSSDPRQAVVSDEQPLVYWAAGNAAAALVRFRVPGDYCAAEDKLKFVFEASMAGATDTPTIAFAGKARDRGEAAAAMATISSSSAITGTTTTQYEVSLSGNSLKPGALVTLTITPGTHATDILYIWGAAARYKSTLALSETDKR